MAYSDLDNKIGVEKVAIIQCSDCGNEVSDAAPSCPKCGRPISTAADVKATGGALTTTQETAKTFKAQSIAAVALIIIGAIWLFTASAAQPAGNATVPSWMLAAGLIWYVVNRFRSWWHHG